MCNTGCTHLIVTGLYHTNNIRETVHNINSLRLDFLTVTLLATVLNYVRLCVLVQRCTTDVETAHNYKKV